jgi:hypothetical protein
MLWELLSWFLRGNPQWFSLYSKENSQATWSPIWSFPPPTRLHQLSILLRLLFIEFTDPGANLGTAKIQWQLWENPTLKPSPALRGEVLISCCPSWCPLTNTFHTFLIFLGVGWFAQHG